MFTPSRLFLAAALLVLPNLAQASATVVNAESQRLMQDANAQLSARQATAAADLYEAALAADPKNVSAYIGLGRVYESLGLPGKALSFYREALEVEPNNLDALEAQAAGLVGKGKLPQAQVNLDRIRKVCKSDCAPARRISTLIAAAREKGAALAPKSIKR